MSLIDHVNIPVSRLEVSQPLYTKMLATLGLGVLVVDGPAVGFGIDHWSLGIIETETPFTPLHLAFCADSKEQVRAFYQAAIEAGATSNGAPGYRPEYGASYFASFALDPDGHNIEAVVRR